MRNKYALIILFIIAISVSGCAEDTYETEYINERFEVKSFSTPIIYGDEYTVIKYIDDGKIKSVSSYNNGDTYHQYNIIKTVDSEKTYLVYEKTIVKIEDPGIFEVPYTFHYYTLYWGDDKKMGEAASDYRVGKWPKQSIPIDNYQ